MSDASVADLVRGTGEPDSPAPAQSGPAAPAPPDDALTITVDGKVFGGWDSVIVTRSCESMPSAFNVSLTERYPGELAGVVIAPGQTCLVKLGADPVLTGYIDRYCPSLDARRHSVRILGRSRSQDLVDCSAIFDSFQISGQTVGGIARTLAARYGIDVLTPRGDGPMVPQLGLQLGETVWDVIERLCRFAKFLAYDDVNGNIVLAPVSTDRHSSGVTEGVNLLGAGAEFSMDQRFSEYQVYPLSVLPLMQAEGAAGGGSLPYPSGEARDDGVKRLRRHIIILEHSGGAPLAQAAADRAQWEQARRAGRSESITVLVDSWRDSAGLLWEPNRIIVVDVPTLQVRKQAWTIAEASFLRSEAGTTARLVLMPPRAFDPQYDPLVAFNWQLAQAGQDAANNFNPRLGEGPGI